MTKDDVREATKGIGDVQDIIHSLTTELAALKEVLLGTVERTESACRYGSMASDGTNNIARGLRHL